ncbi:glycosyl hydrolase [Saccharothrix sp. ALI-22-I]|uniref:glycoside hydrolase family 32 protein n=1 Tax=Saccharothrix sp. ALI-22-I TaxID=1933778 RepID=UPI00097CB1FA|nr:glycoside hydrolase family 32 protein [Saccharothrix sp. ALI-22-I]ONI91120.1 glycosyl hydrolase [Saccharothrix sp. ALI-22-I]
MSTPPPDVHLPAVHLRPPRNWINDPNGLVFHDGHYHVFFQHNPNGPEHAGMHWGHYRSTDLVTWEELPVALAPTPGGDDADGCYSGNAISDGERMLAFYSAYRTDRWWQPIASAESADGGITWRKQPDLAIPTPPEGTSMYRDPYVWREGDRWRMLVGASVAGERGAALLYESSDLVDWRYLGPFFADGPGVTPAADGWTGWECPQYAAFGDRGILVVSLWDAVAGPRSTRVYVGTEHADRFVPTGHQPLDHGPDLYAPALLHAPDGRWLLWGWSWEARDTEWSRAAGWAGVLTVPREVSLTEDGRVRQQPATEVLGYRTRKLVHATGWSSAEDPGADDLGAVGAAFDLTARLRPRSDAPCGLRLETTADGAEHLDIVIDPVADELVVDRDHASLDVRALKGRYRIPPSGARAPDGAVDLRVIVDGSIVEVFLGSGEALTLRCYPTGPVPWRLRTTGGPDHIVDVWQLEAGGQPSTTSRDELRTTAS